MAIKIFVIDDDLNVLTSIEKWLSVSGAEVSSFSSSIDALSELDGKQPDVVITDVRMPDIDGGELLKRILVRDPLLPVILITGHGDIAMAVESMRIGAYHFVEKPFDPEHLLEVVRGAYAKRKLSRENQHLRVQLEHLTGIESRIMGQSNAIQKVRELVLALAGFDAGVIVQGETGTGKELVANCLHDYGPRSDHPFVAINCGAIPENLLESELFGHEKGAFTGANQRRIGKFEYAREGTLFLDEIEAMPTSFQVKLLRALQENQIVRLGANESISVRPRIICATKVKLKELVAQNKFRQDLYYRLMLSEIVLPPLREVTLDAQMLFQHYYQLACEKYNIQLNEINVDDLTTIAIHEWPGNIRELKNTAAQFAINSVIGQSSLEDLIGTFSGTITSQSSEVDETGLSFKVSRFEENLIRASLNKNKGSVKKVMQELQVARRTLNLKMQRYDIQRSEFIVD